MPIAAFLQLTCSLKMITKKKKQGGWAVGGGWLPSQLFSIKCVKILYGFFYSISVTIFERETFLFEEVPDILKPCSKGKIDLIVFIQL